ncbi:hypothetical protein C5Y96_12070 [Blastopirellula marina]|uniref:DUF5666 domain-containing protein n=1 Tax=Blastopirellula marina TaxID=124 RepID=A0A2S8FG10_9BACT|nr:MULTISPECIES: hypothetical protein [Pirellulaceae]PQO31087.1 hypothetical protein C5Y96_12070 [Blastopirellula marina]RCS51481.1 hypothetical protein DTL36_12080 [Bremerella cremea]
MNRIVLSVMGLLLLTSAIAKAEDEPVLSFTPAELYKQIRDLGYQEMKEATEGKWIEVTGNVIYYAHDTSLKRITAAVGTKEDYIHCGMSSADEAWGKANIGDKVTVHMRWSTQNGLHGGKFVMVKGGPPPTIEAADLMSQLKRNRRAALKKFQDKYCLVTGKIAKHDDIPEKFDDLHLRSIDFTMLQGLKEIPITVHFSHVDVSAPNSLEENDEITVLGKIRITDPPVKGDPYPVHLEDTSRVDGDE